MLPIQGKVTLALLSVSAMICSVALYAANVTLTPASAVDTGCEFTDYTRDPTGTLIVTCVDVGMTSSTSVTLTGLSKNINGCEYASYTRTAGNLSVVCVDTLPVLPVVPLTAPIVDSTPDPDPDPDPDPVPSGCDILPEDIPAGCTVRAITWDTQVSVTGPLQSINRGQELAYCVTMPDRSTGGVPSGIVSAAVGKVMTLSQLPCDFSPELLTDYCVAIGSPNLTLQNSSLTTLGAGVCQVTTGATYYFNVKNSTNYPPIVTTGVDDTCDTTSPCDNFFLAW